MRTAVVVVPILYALGACGQMNPPPLPDPIVNAAVICQAQVELCEMGVYNDQCLGWGQPRVLADRPYDGGCVEDFKCPNPPGQCEHFAQALCVQPQCRIVSVTVVSCNATKCGSRNAPPGGQNRPSQGQQVADDPNAPHRILSFEFKLSPPFIEQNPPSREIPISATFGQPQAIDISGFVGTVTQLPSSIIAYDIGPQPPVFGIPPQPLIDIPNTFSMSDAPLLLGNVVVADVVGLSIYDVRSNSIKRTKQVPLMNAAIGLDVDPNFAMTNLASALIKQQVAVAVTSLAGMPMPKYRALPGDPVDLTMGPSDVWIASTASTGTGTITRIGSPSATVLGEQSFGDGEPVAIGGGSSYSNTIPGAIVLLVSKPTAGELRLFLGGNVNAPPVIVPLSGFPHPKPKSMKVVTIDNTQYAWVALLNGTTNTVALYNLATKAHIASFDVDLDALEPLAVTAGVPTPNDPDPDVFTGSTTAFLHVLVKSN